MADLEAAASLGKRLQALALTPLLVLGTLGVGWLVWSVLEWRNSRTPSFRVLGLHVLRLSDSQPVGFSRSLARSGLCCLLVLPTMVVCCVIGVSFVFGASSPDDLLRRPRTAPWDYLTATRVTEQRLQPKAHSSDFGQAILMPIDLAAVKRDRGSQNGHIH